MDKGTGIVLKFHAMVNGMKSEGTWMKVSVEDIKKEVWIQIMKSFV